MTESICYIAAFIAETFTSLFYFEHKFESKISHKKILFFNMISCIASFIISQVDIPTLNIVVFFSSNLLILTICYQAKLKSRIFSCFILMASMMSTELLTMQILSMTLSVNLTDTYRDSYVMYTIFSKLLYFMIIYIISHISTKELFSESLKNTALLSIMPITSVMLMHTTIYVYITYDNIAEYFKGSLMFCDVLLLFSNITVFYIYEMTLKTNRNYMIMCLEKEHEKNNMEYYKLLKEQNENSKILIHDITKHLNSIKQLSSNSSDVNEYIANIIEDFNILNHVDYCNNPLLNLITHRYNEICVRKGIDFYINIQNAKIDFMQEHDITSLFDNILENAVEAAEISENKNVDFSIYIRNTNFLVIKILNSCDQKPKYKNGNLLSSKKSPDFHGIGMKSVKRVVSKYDGNIDIKFNEEEKTFCTTVIFKL